MGEEFIKTRKLNFGLISPFRALLAGSSSCGKSELIARILEHKDKFFPDTQFSHACYYYPSGGLTETRHDYYERLKRSIKCMDSCEGLPDVQALNDISGDKLIIIDDLYDKAVNSPDMMDLMTVHSHHSRISLFFTAQNYFNKGKFSKTFLRNYTDSILFDAKSERLIVEIVSRQIFPGGNRFLPRAMDWLRENQKDIFERYLWIDTNPQNTLPEKLRVRSHIIPKAGDLNYEIVFYF